MRNLLLILGDQLDADWESRGRFARESFALAQPRLLLTMTKESTMNATTAANGTDGECEEIDLAKRIGRLVRGQPYGVLCTQSDSQPYGSLVALAATDDLSALVFATPITTRKYRLLSACDHVAVVMDSRSGAPDELMQLEAVTATGRAYVVPRGPDFERWASLLIGRHPHLAAFVRAESSALFRFEVVRYFHVCHFQEVRQWIPNRPS